MRWFRLPFAALAGALVLSLAPAGAQTPGAQKMAASAQAFLATLSPGQRAAIVRPFTDDAARTNWSNLPGPAAPRDGVAVGGLSDAQRIAFHDLLHASLSTEGYEAAASIMWLDDVLRLEEEAILPGLPAERRERLRPITASRDSGNYWLVVFGDPGGPEWGWMLSGHHLAVNFTIADGKVAFTPLFLGANPQTVKAGRYAGWRVLDHEIGRAFELAGSMNASQRAAMVQGPVTAETFTGRGRKDSLAAPVGLTASKLNRSQQTMLWALIGEFLGDAPDGAAERQLAAIRRDGLGKLKLAWWGSTEDPGRRFLYRIHGPSILIEYSREPEPGAPEGAGANHVHAIVRDPRNDYGEDWLGKHYTEAHQ